MIKILIVDDSKTETEILKGIFNSEKDMKVIACAKNGKEAVEMAFKLKPDLITMDIFMPVMDGIESIRHIMSQQSTPIVVISSKLNETIMNATYEALEAGALSVLEKPLDITSENFKKICRTLVDTVRSMSEIKVIQRRHFSVKIINKFNSPLAMQNKFEIIGIGTSVGGPQALKCILSTLPKNFPVPIVIVQHMTVGFIKGFTQWLNNMTSLTVKEAEDHEKLKKGYVYFAPDHFHLEIKRGEENELRAHLVKSPQISGFCPSATRLLESIATVSGKNSIGILLTGMGSDGAKGLLEIKKNKGLTLIQDSESAVVFGMAGVALSLDAVDKVVKLEKMAEYLLNIFNVRKS